MKRKQKLSFSIPPSYNGLRFFAELAEELLFYFSHDSFKVPTLNFHFLCFEALDVIDKIEAGLLEKGNIIPIVQEFVRSYKDDPIIVEFYGDDINNLFLTKNAEGQYRTVLKELMQSPTSDSSIQRLKKCVLFLRDDLGRKSRYYNSGISKIESLIVKQNISHSEMEQLQKYTKIILTELINIGYSQEYIYTSVLNVFFNGERPIEDAKEGFERFISFFPLKRRRYVIYLPLKNSKITEELAPFTGLDIAENIYEMFNNSCSFVVKVSQEAMDPEKAKAKAIALIDFCLSVSQYCRHNKRGYSFKEAEVVDIESKEVYNLRTMAAAISRQKRIQIDEEKLVNTCFDLESGIFDAIGLHASAFSSKDEKNQLLNLWTAMEVLIPIEKSGSSSKINQISNSAATILSSNYIRTLIVQLDAQIKGKIPDEYEKLMSDIVGTDNAEKLLLILVLSNYSDKFDSLMEQLNSTQLLMFRIQQYKNILSFGHSVKEFYERHAKRVAWQIMRIYRNRNMIVHDGSTLPFLSVILQNLHYYIDTIIDTFCSMNDKRFQDANSIIMKLMLNEQVYLSRLDTTKTFSRDNAIPYLFGYILDES